MILKMENVYNFYIYSLSLKKRMFNLIFQMNMMKKVLKALNFKFILVMIKKKNICQKSRGKVTSRNLNLRNY